MSVIIVSGFGRCGSSLMMQMLHAGGLSTTGRAPHFESVRAIPPIIGMVKDFAQRLPESDTKAAHFLRRLPWWRTRKLSGRWLSSLDGAAVKILMPHLFTFPSGCYRSIWMDRPPLQIANSQARFSGRVLPLIRISPLDPSHSPVLAEYFSRARSAALETLSAIGPVEVIQFEHLLDARHQGQALNRVARFVGGPLDIDAMASVVRPRKTDGSNLTSELAAAGLPIG